MPIINITIQDDKGNSTTASGDITDQETINAALVVHAKLTEAACHVQPSGA